MEQVRRKPNRIPKYDYNQVGAYFVTVCTQDRQPILGDIVGDGSPVLKPPGSMAESLIRQISIKYPSVAVDKYVIMPDHIHLLLRINGTGNPSPTMGTIMGWYKYQLTKEINLHLGTPGRKILQRSFYDHVIRNEQDYREAWDYITYNPYKWLAKQRGYE